MHKKSTLAASNNGDKAAVQEKMAEQIDEIYGRLKLLEGLYHDIMPALEKIPREINSTLNELRTRFEREETLQLIKAVGDNIPTFLEAIKAMEGFTGFFKDIHPAAEKITKELGPTINSLRYAFEREETLQLIQKTGENIPTFLEMIKTMEFLVGMFKDVYPAAEKITKELGPTINSLRYAFEREETLQLIQKTGENIPTFLEMIKTMEFLVGMFKDVYPAAEKITKELGPTINSLRYAFEREETLQLIQKTGENIPTFLEMIKTMEFLVGMFKDVYPATEKIMKELTPTINMMRYAYEKDETLTLLQKTGENIPTFIKLLDFLAHFEQSGGLDYTLKSASVKETEYMIKGMEKCAVRTMQQLMERPLKPGMKNLFSSMMDPEVQKGFILLTTFARNMPQCMLDTIAESEEVIKKKI
ncbi:protein containing DUF1641 [Candidatus Magnetobacterium bavaricum]|uniref:Protein containing DUF1641 n=1 Tax=Candidatus Magnetobacterium bavaricum TaxID=29290 RepID=A0A0F3GM69_9BACT|nr:protein containing DUF1641 [Candidatus Magnetobacterium bavaricum]